MQLESSILKQQFKCTPESVDLLLLQMEMYSTMVLASNLMQQHICKGACRRYDRLQWAQQNIPCTEESRVAREYLSQSGIVNVDCSSS